MRSWAGRDGRLNFIHTLLAVSKPAVAGFCPNPHSGESGVRLKMYKGWGCSSVQYLPGMHKALGSLSLVPHKPGLPVSAYISSRTWRRWESGLWRIRNSRSSWPDMEYVRHLAPPHTQTNTHTYTPHLSHIYPQRKYGACLLFQSRARLAMLLETEVQSMVQPFPRGWS